MPYTAEDGNGAPGSAEGNLHRCIRSPGVRKQCLYTPIGWCMITADFVCVTSMHATRLCKTIIGNGFSAGNESNGCGFEGLRLAYDLRRRICKAGEHRLLQLVAGWWQAKPNYRSVQNLCCRLRESRCLPSIFTTFQSYVSLCAAEK